ncbi:unnamed protein product, partial [Mesorhabditis belari]|uniref:Uncharacterized protein n=1 Tax=Mesorhabditis belari TaxID=2138241 RepID=A0AAF3E809_9BILA
MFPYSFLPEELKNCIVKSIHLNDTSQAFRASKSLEQKILKYGPFPRRISELKIRLLISDYHALDDLVFDIRMSNGGIKFEVSGHNVTLISKDKKIPLNVKGKTFWALLNNKITSLESCTISIWGSPYERPVRRFVQNLFQDNDFLPKADYIFRFHLETHLKLAKIILSRFHFTIRDLLALEISYLSGKEKEANEFLEDLIKRPTLQDCYSIVWENGCWENGLLENGCWENGASILQAPGKLLCFPSENWLDFKHVIQQVFFQENPTASDEKCYLANLPGRSLTERDFYWCSHLEMFDEERGCEELRDDSEEAALMREAVEEVEKEIETRQLNMELFIEESSSSYPYKGYYKKRFVNNEAIYFITCCDSDFSSFWYPFSQECESTRECTFQCFVKYRTIKALDRTPQCELELD